MFWKISHSEWLLKAEPRAPKQKTIWEHGESESYPMCHAACALKVKPEGDARGLNDLT